MELSGKHTKGKHSLFKEIFNKINKKKHEASKYYLIWIGDMRVD
jgi:hypothetical protein